jgi:hypothetical protein
VDRPRRDARVPRHLAAAAAVDAWSEVTEWAVRVANGFAISSSRTSEGSAFPPAEHKEVLH